MVCKCKCCGAEGRSTQGCSCRGGKSHRCLLETEAVVADQPVVAERSFDHFQLTQEQVESSEFYKGKFEPMTEYGWGIFKSRFGNIEMLKDRISMICEGIVDRIQDEDKEESEVEESEVEESEVEEVEASSSTEIRTGFSKPPFQIIVVNVLGSSILMMVNENTSMAELKESLITRTHEMLIGMEDGDQIGKKEEELWNDNRIGFAFKGKQLDMNKTMGHYGFERDDIVRMTFTTPGGGKRGKSGESTTSAKKDQMKTLQEQMESAMFRFVGNNLNNPTIQEVVLNVQAMMRVSKTEDKSAIRATLEAQSDMGLCKLLAITSVSTKPEARCKALSEILFEGSFARLDEIQSQCSSACRLLPNSVLHMMLAIWGGDGGAIAWADFTKMVADVIKDKALAEVNRPAQGGLGG